MIKFFKKKQPIIDTILIMILFSALEMAFMYHVGEDPSRVYYGTDTRMFSILIGAGLAVVWPSTSFKATADPGRHRSWIFSSACFDVYEDDG